MLARIINGQLHQGLPNTGVLNDGRSVSNYDLLPTETLAEEGWKEAIENVQDVAEDECIIIDNYENNGNNIVINYKTEKL